MVFINPCKATAAWLLQAHPCLLHQGLRGRHHRWRGSGKTGAGS
jgi:hypothetical protein